MGYYSEVAFEIAFPDAHDWDSHPIRWRSCARSCVYFLKENCNE